MPAVPSAGRGPADSFSGYGHASASCIHRHMQVDRHSIKKQPCLAACIILATCSLGPDLQFLTEQALSYRAGSFLQSICSSALKRSSCMVNSHSSGVAQYRFACKQDSSAFIVPLGVAKFPTTQQALHLTASTAHLQVCYTARSKRSPFNNKLAARRGEFQGDLHAALLTSTTHMT